MKTRVIALAMAAGLSLLGTGCSSDTETPGGPTTGGTTTAAPGGGGEQGDTPDPCELLTLAEISAQLGEEFTVAKELPQSGFPGQRTCSYEKADSLGTVSVGVWPFDPADVDSFVDQVIGLSAPTEIGQFDGLGDRAFGEPQSLWVLAGNMMVNVAIVFIEVENVDPVLQLGLAAVGRL